MLPLQKWIFQEFQVEMCTLFKKSYSIHGIQEGICSLSKRIIPRNSRRDILTIQKKINPGNSKWDTLPLHKGLFREFQEGICSPSKRIILKGYVPSPKRTISVNSRRDVLHLRKGLFRRDILYTSPKKIIPGNLRRYMFPLHNGLFQWIQEGTSSPSKRIFLKGYVPSPKRTISGNSRRDVLHLQKGYSLAPRDPGCKHVMRVKKSYLAGPRPLFQLIPVSWEPA